MTPTVGRIVHYVNGADCHRPAIVTSVCPHGSDLQVFTSGPYDTNGWPEYYETGPVPNVIFVGSVAEGTGAYTWHWPERDEA